MFRRPIHHLLVFFLFIGANPPLPLIAGPTNPSTWTRTILLTSDDKTIWVVNPDSNSVSVLGNTPSLIKYHEIPVGKKPRTLAMSADESIVYVACQDENEVWIIDTQSKQVIRKVRVGFAPYGVIVNSVLNQILVSNQSSDTLSVLDENANLMTTIALKRQPRGMALTSSGTHVYISHFVSVERYGSVSKVNLQNFSVEKLIQLPYDLGPDSDTSGQGVPNGLSAMAVSPAGDRIWVGGQKSNSKKGLFFNSTPATAANLTRALACLINPATDAEEVNERLDADQAGKVTSIDFSPDGKYVYFVHQGASRVSAYDVFKSTSFDTSTGSPIPYEARIDVGDIPQGIVVTSDGKKAFVMNYLGRSVSELDLSDPAHPVLRHTISVTHEALDPTVALGKRHFFDTRAPMQSKYNNMTCASCHLDGGRTDGQVWDLTHIGEGLRNTMDLRGKAGLDQGPLHWTANVDEIQDFENDIVHGFQGTGLAQDGKPPYPFLDVRKNAGRSKDLDALAAYVTSLDTVPQSPFRNPDGTLTEAGKRGKSIFYGIADCAACHSGPNFTDSTLFPDPKDYILHDVGTLTPGSGQVLHGPLTGLDTPTLKGVWDTEPYLHDGGTSDLIGTFVFEHGSWPSNPPVSMQDLVAYLKQIDGSLYDETIIVNAGGDKGTRLGESVDLLGTVIVDGALAGPHVKPQWALVNGPSGCKFTNPNSYTTTVDFTAVGQYAIEFFVMNNGQKKGDTVIINVQPGSNKAPTQVGKVVNVFDPQNGEKGYVACGIDTSVLAVYNSHGQRVGSIQESAPHIYEWDGKNEAEEFVSSGIYFIECDGQRENGGIEVTYLISTIL